MITKISRKRDELHHLISITLFLYHLHRTIGRTVIYKNELEIIAVSQMRDRFAQTFEENRNRSFFVMNRANKTNHCTLFRSIFQHSRPSERVVNLIARNSVTNFPIKHNILFFLWNEKNGNNEKPKLYFKRFLQTSSEINLGDNREFYISNVELISLCKPAIHFFASFLHS